MDLNLKCGERDTYLIVPKEGGSGGDASLSFSFLMALRGFFFVVVEM